MVLKGGRGSCSTLSSTHLKKHHCSTKVTGSKWTVPICSAFPREPEHLMLQHFPCFHTLFISLTRGCTVDSRYPHLGGGQDSVICEQRFSRMHAGMWPQGLMLDYALHCCTICILTLAWLYFILIPLFPCLLSPSGALPPPLSESFYSCRPCSMPNPTTGFTPQKCR